MPRQWIRLCLAVALSAITMGCGAPPGPAKTKDKSTKTNADSGNGTWVAILDRGGVDKFGHGYELTVRNGRVASGVFYLLPKDQPDLDSAIHSAAFKDVSHKGERVVFSTPTIRHGVREYRFSQ